MVPWYGPLTQNPPSKQGPIVQSRLKKAAAHTRVPKEYPWTRMVVQALLLPLITLHKLLGTT